MYSLLFMRMRQEVLILFSRSPIPHIIYYRMSTIEQNTGNAQADKKECLMQEKKLEMYGGLFGGLIPLIVLVGRARLAVGCGAGRHQALLGLRVDRAVRWDLLR